ncbi:unnamed protein product [Trichogramma brassicae]|uniref:HTH psq-type domain-containing protein n=1 Tax=Trichogramma brassicae TaxID=86971 RepID=A0A6H5J5B0_9HYME|nr:unnamed protein product [Trichogramma brassicae]
MEPTERITDICDKKEEFLRYLELMPKKKVSEEGQKEIKKANDVTVKRKENSMTPRTSITTGTMKQGRKTKSKSVYSSANRSFSSNKRVVKRLLPEDKLKAIECVLIHGQTKASVARTYRVPESTLRSWCKRAQVALENKKNLKAQVGDESSASSARSESPLNNPLTHPVACGSTITEEDIKVGVSLVTPNVEK